MRHMIVVVLIVGAIGVLCSCSKAALLNFTITNKGYKIYKDIAFAAHERNTLDIYVPDGKASQPRPVVFFIYGGSWQENSKNDFKFVGQAFASNGYVVVIADYRVYPNVKFPEFLNDGAAAFVWVHAHIAEYGGDAENMFLVGHSAGGYNAMMLTVNDEYLRHAGGKRSWIRGTIGIAGPYDFLPFTDDDIKAVFSSAPDAQTQPINYVGKDLPPMFLAWGDQDTTVWRHNLVNMAAKLKQFDDPVETKIYPGVAHIGIVLAFAENFRSKTPILEDCSRFIQSHLKAR